jgi:hypothetical protein
VPQRKRAGGLPSGEERTSTRKPLGRWSGLGCDSDLGRNGGCVQRPGCEACPVEAWDSAGSFSSRCSATSRCSAAVQYLDPSVLLVRWWKVPSPARKGRSTWCRSTCTCLSFRVTCWIDGCSITYRFKRCRRCDVPYRLNRPYLRNRQRSLHKCRGADLGVLRRATFIGRRGASQPAVLLYGPNELKHGGAIQPARR